MRKTIILSAIIFTVLLSGSGLNSLFAQSPVGKWVDSRYNMTLVLNGNFTYSFQYQNSVSKGLWSNRGNQFCLKDSSSNVPVCYTVVSYNATDLVLRDVNGIMIYYKKSGGTQQSATSPVKKRVVKGANRIIATKGNYKLTHGHLRAGIDLTQFIIGQKIKVSEVRELKQKLVEEFNAMPGQTVGQLDSIGLSMDKVRSATDPVKIGQVRQQIFAAFHKLTRNMSENQKPLMIQVINRYIKVLAYDEANNLILTNKDVDGYINYVAFNSELAGKKIAVNYAVRNSVTQNLVNGFASMPLGQKQMLSSASLIWELLEYNWSKLTNAQKVQYVNAYRGKIANNYNYNQQSSQNNNNWTPPKNYGSQKKSLSQMRRDFNAKQNMFKMMNNMNLSNHALSLNIIENIGGTGNYWKVTDY